MMLFRTGLRRAITSASSLLQHHARSAPIRPIPTVLSPHFSLLSGRRSFTSSPAVSLSSLKPSSDDGGKKIAEDQMLFDGPDGNHWLITFYFSPDTLDPEKIATYERAAAQVFGSMEEAKKKIYACSTTSYDGFQVECSEETAKNFKDVPGVQFVVPDFYVDPVNKRYGGDKYVNGEITTIPYPVVYRTPDGQYVEMDELDEQDEPDNNGSSGDQGN